MNESQSSKALKILVVVGVVGYVAHLNGVQLPFVPPPAPAPGPAPVVVGDDLEKTAEAAWRDATGRVAAAWSTTAGDEDLSGNKLFDSLQTAIFDALAEGMDPVTDALPTDDDEAIRKAMRSVAKGIKKAGGK